MTNWKTIRKTTVAIALIIGSSLVLSAGEAEAHRKRSKIHGPFGSWTWGPDIPHIHPISGGGSSSSCLAVISSPKEYSWYVKNTKTYDQTFYISGKKYVLGSGQTQYFTSKVGRSASNSCNGTTYKEPTIEFDRYSNDGQYTAKRFVVDVTNYRGFEFWKDGSIIKFSKNKSTQR